MLAIPKLNSGCLLVSYSIGRLTFPCNGSPAFSLSNTVNSSKFRNLIKDGACRIKGIFAPVYDYARNVDLNKCY